MSHDLEPEPTIQPSLLEEPAATVTLRLDVQSTDPYAHVAYQVTRPDGSWIACEVAACHNQPPSIRAQMAKMTGAALRKLFESVGPFA